GSTEVAWASIATPEDLREAPGTAGAPPRGTILRIYDEKGAELPQGETGRIFVGNEMLFEGYTGGGGKDVIDGLMSSGDVGYLDEEGRLHVSGRDDDMIVSGGENVFPREVEDLISNMKGVDEVAVIGVDDEEFGQRLKAFVVTKGSGGTATPFRSRSMTSSGATASSTARRRAWRACAGRRASSRATASGSCCRTPRTSRSCTPACCASARSSCR